MNVWLKLAGFALLPMVAFQGGAWAMNKVVGRKAVLDRFQSQGDGFDKRPLSRRPSYTVRDFKQYLSALADTAPVERRFLELDLLFPFLYGGTLAASSLCLWNLVGRPLSPGLILAPTVLGMSADWTENVTQLHELGAFLNAGPDALNGNWIRAASTATTLKLVFLGAAYLLFGALLLAATKKSLSQR